MGVTEMKTDANTTRRGFIKVVSVAGAGLVLGFHLPANEKKFNSEYGDGNFTPNAWLKIAPDGSVSVTVARTELGQGVRTALPMILAEELEADWSRVGIEPAVADPKYGEMTTGGSTSVRVSWMPLRKAGAVAREMLIASAALTWGALRESCRAENGSVIHIPSGRSLSYGSLAEKAAKQPVPSDVPLKDLKNFKIVGQSLPRLDSRDKIQGSAVYGLDFRLPGMLTAAVSRSPVFGGTVKSYDDKKARSLPGVRNVLQIQRGIAVIADSTWAAFQARDALSVIWEEGKASGLGSAGIRAIFDERITGEGAEVRREGDPLGALEKAAGKVEAEYELPFLAHAQMEPMNCLADVRKDSAEIWVPTQSPQWVQGAVAEVAGLSPEKVIVHTTLAGGGFGRRLMVDYAIEAAQISKAAGAPVKVVWNREDDMRHDYYRPASLHRLKAGYDGTGKLTSWVHRIAAPSISAQLFPDAKPENPPYAVDGAANIQYNVPNILVSYSMSNTPVPVGWWRSVYNSQNAFVNESFIDEVAAAAKVDPFDFRRKHLPEDSRLRKVLELAASEAGWGKPTGGGRGRGIACHSSFDSFVCHVAEVSVSGKILRVHRVVSAVDCGIVVNPAILRAQIEGAVALGLTAALKGEVNIENGSAAIGNFDDYPLLIMEEMPEVEVHIIKSNEEPTGIGEPGLPPIAPAVTNALFSLTGVRIRKLPIRLTG